MTILTKQYINLHCVNLGITRYELTLFVFPSGITKIGKNAFARCTSLTSITIPDSVTEIRDEAFEACTSSIKIH